MGLRKDPSGHGDGDLPSLAPEQNSQLVLAPSGMQAPDYQHRMRQNGAPRWPASAYGRPRAILQTRRSVLLQTAPPAVEVRSRHAYAPGCLLRVQPERPQSLPELDRFGS